VAAGGTYAYGSYPDVEGLLSEQATERDAKKREAIVHRVQQMIHDKAMFTPIWELAFLNGHGPRVAESGLTLWVTAGFAFQGRTRSRISCRSRRKAASRFRSTCLPPQT